MKNRKWLITLFLLSAALLLTLSSAAAERTASSSSELSGAVTALSSTGGTIRLTTDFSVANLSLPQNTAKITLDGGGHILTLSGNLALSGDFDIKNITIQNYGTYRSITCGGHEVHFYDTVSCTKTGSVYPSIMAGFTNAQAFDGGLVTIDGGDWQRVRGGNANASAGTFVQTCDIVVNGGAFHEVFQVAGGGNIPTGSRFTAVINGGTFNGGITFYNTTGSATAQTSLSIYGGTVKGTVSIAANTANIGGSADIWLYGGDFSGCTAINGYSGSGSVDANIHVEKDLAAHLYNVAESQSTLSSSLLRSGAADPCLVAHNGTYYLTMTGTSNIALLKSKDISALAGLTITPNLVYRGAQDTNATENLGYSELSGTWSPELHYFSEEDFGENAGWYMYLALRKETGDSSDISMVALRSANGITPDGPYVHPTTGETYVSQTILDKNGNPFNDEWGCGMSILRIESGPYAGIYATWVGEENRGTPNFRQMIWIAKLQSPWQLAGNASVIMYPTQDWEKICKGSYYNKEGKLIYTPEVVEGATAVYGKDGQVYMMYSGGGYWHNYGIGQMTWNGGDPLSASSWLKYENNPTFACNSVSGSHYTHYSGLLLQGAGHATYFTDADGQMYAVYHAYPCDATGDKGDNARNAYLEPCYIDYSKNNGVNKGVLMVGSGDGKPVNPSASTAVTITLQSEGNTVLDLCDEAASPALFESLDTPAVTAALQANGNILVTFTDDNPGGTTYRVYRATDGESFTLLTTVSEKQYLDTAVAVGTTYTYRIEAYNATYTASPATSGAVTALPAQPVVTAKTLTDNGKRLDLTMDVTVPSGVTLKTTYKTGSGAWTSPLAPRRLLGLTADAVYTVRLESTLKVSSVDYTSAPVEFTFTASVPSLTFDAVTATGFTAAYTFPTGATVPTYTLGESVTSLAGTLSGSRTESGLSAYTDYTVTVAAVRDGITLQTTRTVKTLCAHVWNEGTVTLAPTCTEGGVKDVTCTVCGENSTAEIAALGHDFAVEYTVDVAATCTAAGEKSQHCSRCTAKRNVTGIPATGHRYGEGVETTAPTYTAAGVMTYTCTVCGATRTESIPMLVSEAHYTAVESGAAYDAVAARAVDKDFALASFTKTGFPEETAVLTLPAALTGKTTYYVYKLVGDFMLLTDYTVSEDGLIIDGENGDLYAVSDAALVLYGDATGDGALSLADALRTLRYLADNTVETDLAATDINGSASVTLLDCLAIVSAILNK